MKDACKYGPGGADISSKGSQMCLWIHESIHRVSHGSTKCSEHILWSLLRASDPIRREILDRSYLALVYLKHHQQLHYLQAFPRLEAQWADSILVIRHKGVFEILFAALPEDRPLQSPQ